MKEINGEEVIQLIVERLRDQFVLPMHFALATLTAALCYRDQELSKAVSDILTERGDDCLRNGAAGGLLLKQLADVAAVLPVSPSGTRNELKGRLRLIDGGKATKGRRRR